MKPKKYPHPTKPGKMVSRQRLHQIRMMEVDCCQCCGKKVYRAGYCERCYTRNLRLSRASYKYRHSHGLCAVSNCSKPLVTGWYCQEHRQQINAAQSKLREKRRAAGLCIWCGRAPAISSGFCLQHAVANRELQRARAGTKGRNFSLTYRLEALAKS